MKVVVFDDGSLMGVETALWVRDHGHEVAVVSAPEGLDALPPQEVTDALRGCAVVVDLLHQPSPATGTFPARKDPPEDGADPLGPWLSSTGRLLDAAVAAGVRHHVCLSAVGVDRVSGDGTFRALRNRETMIERSGTAYSILRTTQLFEAAEGIADTATEDGIVRVPPLRVQPVSLTDVAMFLAHLAVSRPLGTVREIAGPEEFALDRFVRIALATDAAYRPVRTHLHSLFFGARPRAADLLPRTGAFIARTSYRAWLAGRPAPEVSS
ncbi:SDR family oxidoreductase [Streptomyces sp. VRA16 Mangrove soil]|uniref:SDR family oxidoreductase n=1 Tax=Streptomyces sp. VRA16 Mangrove soil TaxID=2817434 RepID=UPI001A9FB9D9|nr:NAD(P)H-binding protein [Streptomyces sp. VRA16 Mangrove soil]MBO1332463.1 NAD(P)H-binding protein [Streptomyces sp. VRA16 Mangrove soil]